jgi:hypothetical protein
MGRRENVGLSDEKDTKKYPKYDHNGQKQCEIGP